MVRMVRLMAASKGLMQGRRLYDSLVGEGLVRWGHDGESVRRRSPFSSVT